MLELRIEPTTASSWTKHWYEKIYQMEEIRHLESFYLWLLEILDPQPGQRLLDVACGVGMLPNLAAARGVEAHGTDLSEQAIHTARQEGDAAFVVANGEALPYPDNTFDLVTNIGSLEHYQDPQKGTTEMARVLRPAGLACILLPNVYSILGTVYLALKYGRTIGDNQPLQRFAARKDWEDLLRQNGLRVERVLKYERERPRTLADAGWYLRRPKQIVRLMLTPFIPLNWAFCFVFLCSKQMDHDQS